MASKPDRPRVVQGFTSYALAVGVTPVPISQASQQAALQASYTAFVLSIVPGGTPAILGDSSVLAANGNGIWIPAGVPMEFRIQNERQVYEIQAPLTQDFECSVFPIPISVWNLSGLWLAATGATTVGVMLFQEEFV